MIAKVLADTEGLDEKAIKRALRDAYPLGERKYHPYKIWLDEIHRQRGTGKHAGKGRVVATPDALAKRIAEIKAHNEEHGS